MLGSCSYRPTVALLLLTFCGTVIRAQNRIIVARSGKADFNSIQGAINSLPDSSARHSGSGHEDSKTVLINCRFKGYDGFLLGRYHRDAQIYLVNCLFAQNMRDSAIYLVPTANSIRWGKRAYFYNCHRDGGKDYSWFSNNLPSGITVSAITPEWVFKDRWKPYLN